MNTIPQDTVSASQNSGLVPSATAGTSNAPDFHALASTHASAAARYKDAYGNTLIGAWEPLWAHAAGLPPQSAAAGFDPAKLLQPLNGNCQNLADPSLQATWSSSGATATAMIWNGSIVPSYLNGMTLDQIAQKYGLPPPDPAAVAASYARQAGNKNATPPCATPVNPI